MQVECTPPTSGAQVFLFLDQIVIGYDVVIHQHRACLGDHGLGTTKLLKIVA